MAPRAVTNRSVSRRMQKIAHDLRDPLPPFDAVSGPLHAYGVCMPAPCVSGRPCVRGGIPCQGCSFAASFFDSFGSTSLLMIFSTSMPDTFFSISGAVAMSDVT